MTPSPKAPHDAVALLEADIQRSGLSARQYAMKIMLRDERTIRRWLARDAPIPKAVVDFLVERRPK